MPPQPLRADAARNARRIVDAAYSVFAAGGVTVPMEEIAAAAGVGVATLYRRFPHKQDLVRAVLEARFDEVIVPVLSRAASAAPRDGVYLALEAAVGLAAVEQPLFAAANNVGALTMDLAWRFFSPVAALVAAGQASGVFRADLVADDVPRLVLMLVGTLPSFPAGASEGWRRYLDLLMDALSPSGASGLSPASAVADHTPRI
ncbi:MULTISPECIES: TetR/AcrR family transcriptional regulator [unclassified Amycolatopsis]|uniref:TetR/AcrR family transcriptional regulator n=1 Tax=unclassified Amycolatopsis TaxID=2618356 RepID=UPI001C6A2EFA|nr:TetR family transcriptional regulator [Amycolatopsis sp. DSM 110486]QYN23025.1 TetR/AcrR family transcriptional regulator [Amycolatopsis sp. DSM 110486]